MKVRYQKRKCRTNEERYFHILSKQRIRKKPKFCTLILIVSFVLSTFSGAINVCLNHSTLPMTKDS